MLVPSVVRKTSTKAAKETARPNSNSSDGLPEQVQSGSQKSVDTIADQNGSSIQKQPELKTIQSITSESVSSESVTKTALVTVKVGWIVQVGVFIEQAGAERVVQDLRSKGFNPSTSIVDTNRGKDTGTRIWLGPFEQRVAAAKAKTRLKNETGEAGFIRAYP
jgi:cell division septation protein DedD